MRQVLFVLTTLPAWWPSPRCWLSQPSPTLSSCGARRAVARPGDSDMAEGAGRRRSGGSAAGGAAGDAAMVHQVMAGRNPAPCARCLRWLAAPRRCPESSNGPGRGFMPRPRRPAQQPLLAVFPALGFGLEWLYWWAGTGIRTRFLARHFGARANACARSGGGLSMVFASARVRDRQRRRLPAVRVAAAAQGGRARLSHGVFDRAPGLVLGRFLLAPGAERFRVIPWRRRAPVSGSSGRPSSWAGSRSSDALDVLYSASATAGYGRLLPRRAGRAPLRRGGIPTGRSGGRAARPSVGAWLLSLYVIVVWRWRCTGRRRPSTWASPSCCCRSRSGAPIWRSGVLRPADSEADDVAVPSLAAVTVERGLRAALLIGGAT